MRISTVLTTSTLGLAGLVAAGLLAVPGGPTTAAAEEDRFAKRDEDTTEVVLVADDDDDDTFARDDTRTRSRSRGTASRSRNDGTGTGAATGRDDSRERRVVDMTDDGPGVGNRDRSARHTNDRSRHNTRR